MQGNLPQYSHRKESRVKKHFPTEKASPQEIKPVQGKNETLFNSGSLIRKKLRDKFLRNRDHLLAEAKYEILKQECKVDTLDTCVREFQRQAHSNRLEMDNANYGYGESRRERTRHHEDLAQREKALRDTRMRNMQNVEELKKAKEMRIHATIQELTSHVQELQEIMNCLGDSQEFQDVPSICSGKLSHVRSQSEIVPSLCGMLSRDRSLRPETWNLLGTSGNAFGQSTCSNSSSTPYQGMLHSWSQSATGG